MINISLVNNNSTAQSNLIRIWSAIYQHVKSTANNQCSRLD